MSYWGYSKYDQDKRNMHIKFYYMKVGYSGSFMTNLFADAIFVQSVTHYFDVSSLQPNMTFLPFCFWQEIRNQTITCMQNGRIILLPEWLIQHIYHAHTNYFFVLLKRASNKDYRWVEVLYIPMPKDVKVRVTWIQIYFIVFSFSPYKILEENKIARVKEVRRK